MMCVRNNLHTWVKGAFLCLWSFIAVMPAFAQASDQANVDAVRATYASLDASTNDQIDYRAYFDYYSGNVLGDASYDTGFAPGMEIGFSVKFTPGAANWFYTTVHGNMTQDFIGVGTTTTGNDFSFNAGLEVGVAYKGLGVVWDNSIDGSGTIGLSYGSNVTASDVMGLSTSWDYYYYDPDGVDYSFYDGWSLAWNYSHRFQSAPLAFNWIITYGIDALDTDGNIGDSSVENKLAVTVFPSGDLKSVFIYYAGEHSWGTENGNPDKYTFEPKAGVAFEWQ